MKEFSLEWFIYLNPPMPKIMRDSKGQVLIEKFKACCSTLGRRHEFVKFSDFLLYFH